MPQPLNPPLRTTRRHWLRLMAAGGSALGLAGLARAQAGYPARPIQLVVPFSAGGATDVLARHLARSMEQSLRQPVVVDNRVGAAGAIAATHVARAAPDGHTALFGGVGTNALLEYTQPALPYRPASDFVGAGNFCFVDFVMVVAAASPDQDLAGLLARAKQRPGEVSYMSAGPLGTLHVAQEYLWKLAGVSLNHIPYKGEAHVVSDLVSGRVDLALMTLSLARQLAQEGKLRQLATLAPERLRGAPDLPTVAELGFPGFAMPTWNGVFLPRGTPAARVGTLNGAINAALRDAEVLHKVVGMGISPSAPNTPEQHARFMQAERERWRAMVERSGVKTG
ncbi:MAG: tripartite tricarboxylate transporter substrate binding protein [Comamonadaceae bacterium]|uniref:Bug family tripartite tricarboxylate transporter substrate binding protein n=1 Tax=Hydrogenophaga sp. SNF1 TaxID=3098762 RepID=UPI002ACC05D3|nr:tripartite tricarboxylate transporter substrate binding protein [Hydrogenophaga sp. SNF1]NCT98321.1 tripartite tricarboxylate transporter substrate binding protein [Comamonadaceae bacterium]WQB83908.1 tripartite tricarboxylate transporter substrate binding protein [Hydrogenophaga sp. SNF1]